MTDLPLAGFLALSAVLLGIGIFGILTRRNFILLLIAIEVAINSAILNFVVFGADRAASRGTASKDRPLRSFSSVSPPPRWRWGSRSFSR